MIKTSIRWVGGKKRLLPEILQRAPSFKRYYEPFVGGGAVLHSLEPLEAIVGDANEELMNYYSELARDWRELYEVTQRIPLSKESFLYCRALDRDPGLHAMTKLERAARFLFLNKTSFQGMWRINRHGFYTTPYCYPNKLILSPIVMQQASELFQRVTLSTDYKTTCQTAQAGDFVYFDPPYYHSVKSASMFQGYTALMFDNSKHVELRDECVRLNSIGAKFLLSNTDCPEVRQLWSAFQIDSVAVKQTMAGKSKDRKQTFEVLIKNF